MVLAGADKTKALLTLGELAMAGAEVALDLPVREWVPVLGGGDVFHGIIMPYLEGSRMGGFVIEAWRTRLSRV